MSYRTTRRGGRLHPAAAGLVVLMLAATVAAITAIHVYGPAVDAWAAAERAQALQAVRP